jgi:hypothetical protein
MTRNGVVIDKNIVEGVASDFVSFIDPATFTTDDTEKVYSMASVFDSRLEQLKMVDNEDYID